MATDSSFLSTKRYAVVTGANKGIGLEICRQLASKGVVVVLTARDEKRGREAVEKLIKSADGDVTVEFHQLDVADPSSVNSLANFIKTQFGKLDILVNNAGVGGGTLNDPDLLEGGLNQSGQRNFKGIINETYEMAEECIDINYYGTKRTTEALLPLLYSSDSPRIVNVSSSAGKLEHIPNEQLRSVLDNAEEMNEEKIDELLGEFLKDFKEGKLVEKGWPSSLSAYTMSKAAMNAYARIMSKACRPAGVDVNCVCPGYVITDLTANTGYLTAKEGAESPVRLALLPRGESSGVFYIRKEVVPF